VKFCDLASRQGFCTLCRAGRVTWKLSAQWLTSPAAGSYGRSNPWQTRESRRLASPVISSRPVGRHRPRLQLLRCPSPFAKPRRALASSAAISRGPSLPQANQLQSLLRRVASLPGPRQHFTNALVRGRFHTRKDIPTNPAKRFQRTLTAHLTAADGRAPFEPEEEAAILSVLRQKRKWPAFEGMDFNIGSKGFRSMGFHEKGTSPPREHVR